MPLRDGRSRSPARPPPAPRTWTPLFPLLSEAGLPSSPLLTRLLDLTLDRTVLFCELTSDALRDISRLNIQEPNSAWALLVRVQQTASRVTPLSEVSDPRRYLPEGAADDSHLLGDPFELRARRARPLGWTWLEFLAAGGLLTGSALGLCLEAVFREDHFLREANRGGRDPHRPLLSFSARCHASGCSWLMLSVQVDESLPSHRSALWHGGPRQRLSQADIPSPISTSTHGWRYPGHLLAERVIRTQLQSIAGSWMSTRSAWFAWCAYMRAHWPLLPHFPAPHQCLSGFSAFFSNGDTLAKYLQHIGLASRLHGVDDSLHSRLRDGLVRGARKYRAPDQRPVLRQPQALDIIRRAVDAGDVQVARIYTITRHYMLRARSELFPLQADGLLHQDPRGCSWHSRVLLRLNAVAIELRKRKNAELGDVITRCCLCRSSSPLLCGPCALGAQISRSRRLRLAPDAPLFSQGVLHRASERLRAEASRFGWRSLGWHAFRRGMASDLLNSGGSLSQILYAGGWRSGAFLRYLARRDVDARASLEATAAASESD